MFRRILIAPAFLSRAASASTTLAAGATAPARKLNAYMKFAASKRAEVKAANPGASVTEMAKILGGMWRELTPAAKEGWKTA